MPKISVIMPVYNAGAYLSMAVDSILSQSMNDFELLLIDDGSTDDSGRVCDEYAEKDARVVVVHQKNAGICAARNRGLSLMTGEYVAFADNDDEYLPGLLEDAYALAKKHDADMVKFERLCYTVKNGRKVDPRTTRYTPGVYRGDELKAQYVALKKQSVFAALWDGLYRAALIRDNGLLFDTSLRHGGEDILFSLSVFQCMHCMVLHDKVYYVHYVYMGQSTSGKFHREALDLFVAVANKYQEVRDFAGVPDRHDGERELSIIDNHLFYMLDFLSYPDCDMTLREKAAYLKDLKQQPGFAFAPDREQMRGIAGVSRRKAVMARLIRDDHFIALIRLHQVYSVIIRWKKHRAQRRKGI